MGKIADALTKRSIERKHTDPSGAPSLPELLDADTATLSRYDRETGHLLAYSRESGQVDGAEIERLRQEGTIQRLLDHRLIYPTGKLTPRGIEEAERAARHHARTARPAADSAGAEIVSLDFPAPVAPSMPDGPAPAVIAPAD